MDWGIDFGPVTLKIERSEDRTNICYIGEYGCGHLLDTSDLGNNCRGDHVS